jgi:hypothetical protein
MPFGGLFIALEAWAGIITSIMTRSLSLLASYISKKRILHRKPLAAKAACEPRIPEPCLSFQLSGMRIRGVPELQWYASKSCGCTTNKWAYVSYFDTSTQYHLVCFACQMGLANMQCWICHGDMLKILRCTRTSTIGKQMLRLCHEYLDTGTQYRVVCFNSQMRLVNKQYLIRYQDMPWILWCTGASWANIVMTDRSLDICLSHFILTQSERYWEPGSGYSWHSRSICWPKVEVPVHLNFDHVGVQAPALAQICEPCLILRHNYSNIT